MKCIWTWERAGCKPQFRFRFLWYVHFHLMTFFEHCVVCVEGPHDSACSAQYVHCSRFPSAGGLYEALHDVWPGMTWYFLPRYRSFSWSLIVISSVLVPSVRCISSRVFGLILHFFYVPPVSCRRVEFWLPIRNLRQVATGWKQVLKQIWEQIQTFQRSISWSIPDSLHRSLGCIHHLAVQLEPLGSQDSHIRGPSNFQRIDRSDWKLKTCWPLEEFGKGG